MDVKIKEKRWYVCDENWVPVLEALGLPQYNFTIGRAYEVIVDDQNYEWITDDTGHTWLFDSDNLRPASPDEVPELEETTPEEDIASDNLDEASDKYAREYLFSPEPLRDVTQHFKAGAEWQEQQDQKKIEVAEGHAMFAGEAKGRDEVLKVVRELKDKARKNKLGAIDNMEKEEETYWEGFIDCARAIFREFNEEGEV